NYNKTFVRFVPWQSNLIIISSDKSVLFASCPALSMSHAVCCALLLPSCSVVVVAAD
ncbi:hypothetical protein L9F63_027232, partial [Diploptera punctata]